MAMGFLRLQPISNFNFQQAHNKMTKLVLGNHGSDDDDIDLREEDSDDEYDVAEECARELNTDRRCVLSLSCY
ncbi:unnamed protein product [Clavelina lepadiformis]|uniref:Uncharacterized protein n=1 Tax=Clavelina lepadiformis TaxID=159417 RepID=A0ABP0GZA8_CLALP